LIEKCHWYASLRARHHLDSYLAGRELLVMPSRRLDLVQSTPPWVDARRLLRTLTSSLGRPWLNWIEHLTTDSNLTNCTSFRSFAYRRRRWVIGGSAFAPPYAELRCFAAKNPQTVENDREDSAARLITARNSLPSLRRLIAAVLI
jgi:hypothetical protein